MTKRLGSKMKRLGSVMKRLGNRTKRLDNVIETSVPENVAAVLLIDEARLLCHQQMSRSSED